MLTKESRDKVRAGAHQKAKELKSCAFKERTVLDASVYLMKEKLPYTPIGTSRLLKGCS